MLDPRKPQSDATEKEKHVDTHVTAPAEPVEGVAARQPHMEKDDEEHGRPHQLTTVAADVGQFYIGYLHHLLLSLSIWALGRCW